MVVSEYTWGDRLVLFTLAFALVGAPMRAADEAKQEDFRMLPHEVDFSLPLVQAGQPVATVVTPLTVGAGLWASPSAGRLAEELAAAVQARTGVELPVVSAAVGAGLWASPPDGWTLAPAWQARPLIALGNVINNRVFLKPYASFLDFADGAYPGGAGYELRTVVDPWGGGANLLLVGASTDEGLERGVRRLVEIVQAAAAESGDFVLPRQWEFVFDGPMRENVAAAARPTSQDLDGLYTRALAYQITGEPADLAHAVGVVNGFRTDGRFDPQRMVGPTGDYTGERWHRGLRIVLDSPALTAEERTDLENAMLQALRQSADGYWRSGSTAYWGNRHQTHGTNAFDLGVEYLLHHARPHPAARALLEQWHAEAVAYYSKLDRSYRDENMSNATLHGLEVFFRRALEQPIPAFFESGMARAVVLFEVSLLDNLGSLAGIGRYEELLQRGNILNFSVSPTVPLALAQYVYADPQLQWLVDHRASRSHGGWAFGLPVTDVGLYRRPAGAVPAIEPTDFLGCVRLPVSPLHFARSMGEASVGAGLRASPSGEAVSPEEAAPLICFRSGFEPFDDYLLLVGLHAQTEDLMAFPNAIGRFTAEGHVWLLQNTERLGPYYLNAGYVSDGQPPTGVQPYARVLACGRLPEGGMTATRAENYNGVDWTRSLFWRRNGFFVVLDRLQPRADAQSDRWSTQCVWRTPSSARWDGRTWTSAQGPARLVLQHSTPIPATSQQENEVDPVGPPLPYVLRQRQPLDGREGVAVYQNLLYIRGPHHHNRLELRRWNDDAVLLRGRVAGEDYLALLAAGDGEQPIRVESVEVAARLLWLTPAQAVTEAGPVTIRWTAQGRRRFLERLWDTAGTAHPLPAKVGSLARGLVGSTEVGLLVSGLVGSFQSDADKPRQPTSQPPSTSQPANQPTSQLPSAWTFSATPTQPVRAALVEARVDRPADRGDPRLERLIDGLLPLWDYAIWERTGPTVTLTLERPTPVAALRITYGTIAPLGDFDRASLTPRPIEPPFRLAVNTSGRAWEEFDPARFTVTGRTAVQHVYKGLACGSAQHTVTFDPPVRARRLRVAFPEAVNLSELEAFEPRRGPVRLMKWVADAAGRWPVFAAAYEDGTLLVLDTQGRLLWRATAREAITDAVLDDLDGDGQWELVIVTLEHQAHCFDARGQVRWSVPFLAKDLGECASPMSVGTAADPSSPPLVAPPQSPPTLGGKGGNLGQRVVVTGNYHAMTILAADGTVRMSGMIDGGFESGLLPRGLIVDGREQPYTIIHQNWGSLLGVDVQEQRTVGGVGSFTAWTQGLYLDPRQDQLEVVVVTTAGVQRCPVKDLFGRDGTGTEARPITTEVKVTNESPGHAPLAGWTADVGPVTAHALLHPPSVPPFARGGGSRVLVGRGDGFLCAVEPDGRTTVLARLPQPITGLMVVPRKKQNGTASATISDFGFRISDFGRDSGFRNSQFAIHNPQSGTASVPYLFVSTADELLCCEADGHILRRYAGGATGLWVVPDKELVVIAALPNGTLARLAIEIGRP